MHSKRSILLGAIQLDAAQTLAETFTTIRTLIASSIVKKNSFACIVLPEYVFGTLKEWKDEGVNSSELFAYISKRISNICQEFGIAIVAGSLPFKTGEERWCNRSHLFSATGQLMGYYDKQHPFRTEKLLGLLPGKQTPIFEVDGIKVGLLICSDLWFVNSIQKIAANADLIAVPTMTTVLDQQHTAYGKWAWQSLVSVRAKELIVPIVSADHTLREYLPGIYTCGASCIADPSYKFPNNEGPSTQALKIAPSDKASLIISRISLKAIRDYREYRRNVGLYE